MIERYNSVSYVSIYDSRYKQLQYAKFAPLLDKLRSHSGLMIDFGAGTGLLFDYLLEISQNTGNSSRSGSLPPLILIGVDIAVEMLKIFRGKVNHSLGSAHNLAVNPFSLKAIHLICADGEHLPFRSHQMDYALSVTSLQNLPEPERGLIEISRVLTRQGSFGLSYLKKKATEAELKAILQKYFQNVESICEGNLKDEFNSSPSEDYLFVAKLLVNQVQRRSLCAKKPI